MRVLRFGAGSTVVFALLACSGVDLPATTSSGSEQARALCEHLSKELDSPCVSLPAGATANIDDLQVKVDQVKTWTGKSTLPEIKNYDERRSMRAVNNHALALELTFTNPSPVKQSVEISTYIINGNGDEAFIEPYNTQLYSKGKEGWIDFWNDDTIGPGKSRQAAMVFAVAPDAVPGTKLILRKSVKRPDPKDPRGRIRTFVDELVVLDLGPPT